MTLKLGETAPGLTAHTAAGERRFHEQLGVPLRSTSS